MARKETATCGWAEEYGFDGKYQLVFDPLDGSNPDFLTLSPRSAKRINDANMGSVLTVRDCEDGRLLTVRIRDSRRY
jgi:hypothetical protein